MSWNLFKQNENSLNKDEREAALILKSIVHGYRIGQPDYIPNGIEMLSVGLYYLSFKRANRKSVSLEDFKNPAIILKNPQALLYFTIFKSIKQTLEQLVNSPLISGREISLKEFENTILTLLNHCKDEIKKI